MTTLTKPHLSEFRPSVIMLVVANVIPLIGVLLWEWSVFQVVVLYWLENVVIGVINIAKMAVCTPSNEALEKMHEQMKKARNSASIPASKGCHQGIKVALIPFFTIHYFAFCAGHGFFVFALLGGAFSPVDMGQGMGLEDLKALLTEWQMLLAIAGLFVSHLFSFAVNYIGKGEFRNTSVDALMFSPYGRIVILHVAIIFGGFGVMALGSPLILLLLLVVMKTVLDVVMHLRAHRKMEKRLIDPGGQPA